MPTSNPYDVPARLRSRVDEITARTDAIARAHLDEEYAELARRMAAALARKRPAPIRSGEVRTWAAGIVHAVGWVNFLSDPATEPHMTTKQLAAAAGVGQGTLASVSRKVRDALELIQMDPDWTRPSDMLDNPLAWFITLDGMAIDARQLPRETQEEVFKQGLIPFVPGVSGATGMSGVFGGPAVGGAAGEMDGILPFPSPPSMSNRNDVDEARPFISLMGDTSEGQDMIAGMHARLQQILEDNPNATMDELNAVMSGVVGDYNLQPQAELGGLSPDQVQSLISSDWQSADSAVRLNESLTLADLEDSSMFHDARLLMTMLAERGEVKATQKGNLPREFVREFRDRMRTADVRDTLSMAFEVHREDDLFALHLTRILLTLAGIVRLTKRSFQLTKRGRLLAADERAGELFATLFRTHFRKLSLAWLDRLPEVIELQHLVAFTICRFGQVGDNWNKPKELTQALLLPIVLAAVPPPPPSLPEYDYAELLLDFRVLIPLVRFGLAEAREPARGPGLPFERAAYRKSSLFDRFLTFHLGGNADGRPL